MGPPDEASDKNIARPELARPDNDWNRSEGDLASDVRSIGGAIASVNELDSRIHMEVRKVLSSAMRDATNSGFIADVQFRQGNRLLLKRNEQLEYFSASAVNFDNADY